MIQVNTNYRVSSWKHGGWMLETRKEGKDKDGNKKEHWTPRFYPNFEQCARKIVEEEASLCSSLDEVLKKMDEATNEVASLIHKTEDPV